MKRTFIISLMLVASMTMFAQPIPAGYVDLGLPSGTLWKANNEPGLYMYLTAKNRFDGHLPSDKQFYELFANCSCKWLENGCRVTGPNDNSIFFSFDGFIDCDEEMQRQGEYVQIWLNEEQNSTARYMDFSKAYKQHNFCSCSKCVRNAVHLVISGE